MTIKKLNKSKLPIVQIDNTLTKFKRKVLFKKKLDDANAVLKKTGLPKITTQR